MNFLPIVATIGGIFEPTSFTHAAALEEFSRPKRLINGINTTIEKFPYLVSFEWMKGFECGGTIISRHYIVTAAHCLKDYYHPFLNLCQVRAGSSFRERQGSLHNLTTFVVHPEYNKTTFANDVAVIQLKNPIEFDKTKKPIVMFESGEEITPETILTVAGWGQVKIGGTKPDQLQSATLKLVDSETCEESWRGVKGGILTGQRCVTDTDELMQSLCYGDSGGPLVVDAKLAGIVSYTNGCKNWNGVPDVFTVVSYFREWIDETILQLRLTKLKESVSELKVVFPFLSIFESPSDLLSDETSLSVDDNYI